MTIKYICVQMDALTRMSHTFVKIIEARERFDGGVTNRREYEAEMKSFRKNLTEQREIYDEAAAAEVMET